MDPELKKLLEEQGRAFEEFKVKNDAELAEIKKNGTSDVVLKEHVDRINGDISKLQKSMDDLAVKANRPARGADGKEVDPDQEAYKKAFDGYFRKGRADNIDELHLKAMQTQSDPDGGYIVPPEMDLAIDRVLAKVSAMRANATVRQISSGTFIKPFQTGAAATGWVGEIGSRTETTSPKISQLQFPAMELYAMPAATQTMLDDSAVNIESWLADEIGTVFAEQEGTAFVSGNGVMKPKGIIAYDTVADASWAWGKLGYIATGAAADFSATVSATANPTDTLIDAAQSLKQGYRPNAKWLMNRTVEGKVRKFKDTTGQYIWAMGLQPGAPATLLGYPVLSDDNMPDVAANAYPVAFGDFQRGYLIVDRVGTRVLRDPYSSKPYVLFYTTKRVGGGVQNFEAIKLVKCASS